MKRRISSLVLALILLFNLLPFSIIEAIAEEKEITVSDDSTSTENTEDYITGMVSISCDGKTTVTLPKGEKLYAFATPDESLGNVLMYSWELMTSSGKWASVSGYVSYYAIISDALLFNATGTDGAARMRCIVTSGDKKYVSDILTVLPASTATETLSSASAPSYLSGPLFSEEEIEEEDKPIFGVTPPSGGSIEQAFNIVIDYTYLHLTEAPNQHINGKTAHNTFTVTLPPNSSYSGTIATPPEIGYLPYVAEAQASFVTGYSEGQTATTEYGGNTYVLAHSIQFDNQKTNQTVHVVFIPQQVTYRVKIYEQNLHNDEYILAQTLTKTGIANAAVGKGHDTKREGFQSLYYDPELPISEDGSYVLDIYYDRNYYLIEFDLQDESAFGARNHYVRYKTTVMLPTPTRPAHSFINWVLNSVTIKKSDNTFENVTNHSYPATAAGGYLISSVEHNMEYQASWRVEKTSYTIIYWLENAENDGFTLDSFEVVSNVTPGTVVSASNTLKIDDASCFTFNSALSDKNVKVSADGTTAINAYYLRNYYTMTFKGNAKCVTPEHTHDATCGEYGHCDLTVHAHTEACYDKSGKTECEKEEHTHEDACCSLTEHAHDDKCCTIDYHVHGTGASSDCTKREHPVHHNTCYTSNEIKIADNMTENELKTAYSTLKRKVTGPINGYVYRVRITTGSFWNSTSVIYNFLYAHNTWFYLGTGSTYNGVEAKGIKNPGNSSGSTSSAAATLKCGLEVHTHGDGNCTCKITEHDHTSGCTCTTPRHVHGEGNCQYDKCGKTAHKHVSDCYHLICTITEHTHGGNCVRECQQIEHTHTTGNTGCQTKKSQNFLTFKYKYNADISRVWQKVWELFPNGERWDADTYFSQVLVYLPFMPPANITFSSDVGSANKIYNISYYLESLDSTGTEYNDRYFTLNNTVNAKYNYLTRAEDFFDIPGFTQLSSTPGFSNNQISTNSGGAVSLYYSRNVYDLEFVSLGTTLSTFTKKLKYQQSIDSSFELFAEDVPYPSNKENGAIRFVGWYTTPNCAAGTEFVFDGNTTMPIGGLVLYAKWEACSYNVKIFSDVQKDTLLKEETVLFDSLVVEPHHGGNVDKPDHDYNPEDPEDPETPDTPEDEKEKLIFAGWYYIEGGAEKRFDFNTMPIKGDMVIYAKWTSHIPVRYTIHYVIHALGEDGQPLYTTDTDGKQHPVYTDIAEPTTGASLAGLTKNFIAKVDTALNSGYQVNYFPDVHSHSMTMSSTEAENVYLFVYSSPDSIEYKVEHIFTDARLEDILGTGNNTLPLTLDYKIEGEHVDAHAASVAISFREGITEGNLIKAVKTQYGIDLNIGDDSDDKIDSLLTIIASLSPNAYILDLILTTNDAANVATFNWQSYTNQAIYQIIYYKESLDGTEYIVDRTSSHVAALNTGITLLKKDLENKIEYFELDETKSRFSGTVVQPTFDTTTGNLTQGLVLSIYYTRKEYTYTVYHRNNTTGADLAEAQTLSAKYEHTIYVSDLAMTFNGYTLANGSESIKISADNTQTITCSYQGLEVYYQYQVLGMGATIDEPSEVVAVGSLPPQKTLTLWSDGYFLNSWSYSVGNGERKALPAGWGLSTDSDGNAVIAPTAPTAEWAGKTVYIYAEIFPTIRRFRVEGYHSIENDPQAFVFHLKGKDAATAGIDLTFFIFDSGYIDIAQLPYGKYTLTTLHWAWRPGHPTSVSFNETNHPLEHEVGYVEIDLNTTGDVIIRYPGTLNDAWLSDDASGMIPVESKPSNGSGTETPTPTPEEPEPSPDPAQP